ncbi:MAG: hypothetical protein IPP69_06940 [Flavobacteriales bacterium]|nr:hypothetical protein [Flavobacteriales bacterium]
MVIGLLSFCLVCGQSMSTDSLLQKVKAAGTDADKLDAILEVCMRNDIDLDTFNELAFESKDLAERSGDKKKIGLSAYFVAWAHYLESNNDSSRISIDEALFKLDESNPDLSDVIFKLKSFKATTYQSEQNNTEALRILFPLLDEVQKKGNKLHIAQTMHLIAIIEGQQKNALKTIEWEKQALPLLEEDSPNANNVRSTVLATMGKAYMQLNMIDSAVFYNSKAIDQFEKTEDLYNLAIALQRQAKMLTSVNDLTNVKVILDRLSALNEQIHMGDGDMNYWMSFINYHIQSKEYDKAIALIQDRLQKAGESSERNATKWGIRLEYYEALAKCYKAQGDLKSYGKAMEDILMAKDSLYDINSAEAIADIQTKYEVQKKENTIIEQKLQLSKKNIMMYGSLVFFLTISIFLWLHFRNNSRRQKLEMQIQMQQDKMKSEQAIRDAEENERKRIAADLHDNLGSYAASIVSNIQHLHQTTDNASTLRELGENSQAMVSMLSDTIWALKKEKLSFTMISDRVKVMLQRLGRSYPGIQLEVIEDIEEDFLLQPSHAFQLFSIIQEAVNNALKHSHANVISVVIHSRKTGSAYVRVMDNGTGKVEQLESSESGNGLYNMRHRAELLHWQLSWKPNNDQGIVVEINRNNTN